MRNERSPVPRTIQNVTKVGAGGQVDAITLESARARALALSPTVNAPGLIPIYPGVGHDYAPDSALRFLDLAALHYPREAVTLQKGGTYDTIKKAVDAAGNAPILVVPDYTVAASGGDYTTLTACLAAAPAAGSVILVKNGTYAEKTLVLDRLVHVVGESRTGTILNWSDGTATPTITADFSMANLTIACSGAGAATGIQMSVTGLNAYAYNLDGTFTSDGFIDSSFDGIGTWELRGCYLTAQTGDVFAVYDGAGTVTATLVLNDCYFENNNGTGILHNLGDVANVTARYCTFNNILTGASPAAEPVIQCATAGDYMTGHFDHCYILNDMSGATGTISGDKIAVLVDNASEVVNMIDCVVSVLLPAGQSITNHLKRTAGTLRQCNTTVPTGQTLSLSAGVTTGYKIDPLAR